MPRNKGTPLNHPQALPTIDLRLSDDECATHLRQAFTETGFAYVKHHGVPLELMTKLETQARQFFSLPLDTKNAVAMRHAGRAWRGYFQVGAEYTAGKVDQKEGLYFGVDHPADSPGVLNQWPMHGKNLWPKGQAFSDLPYTVGEYMSHMIELGHRLMRYVALGLGLDAKYFEKRFTNDPTVLFRIFNYPKQPSESSDWGVGEHTDMGFLTILLQDNLGGLEVMRRDGVWLKAPPIKGTFVINIGDMLQHLTHGVYKATLHRVRNSSGKDRLSFPFFFDPNWTSKLRPIATADLDQTLLNAARKDPYRQRWDGLDLSKLNPDTTYGDFVWSKIQHVFPDLAALDPSTDGVE